MKIIKSVMNYLWKLPVCGIGFFIGMAVSGAVLPKLGFESPAIPEGTDANTIALWFLFGSLILAFVLSFLSKKLHTGFVNRWWILSLLTWGAAAVSMVLEAFFFMDTGAVSSGGSALFTIFNFLLPAISVSALVALLFRPGSHENTFGNQLVAFFSGRSFLSWLWRFLVVLAAFPIIYISFGLLVNPLIIEYYQTGAYELVAPTWAQLIPLQLARSFLFLVICLPVLVMLEGKKRDLIFLLGLSLTVLIGFMSVITSYWFPWQMRLFHGMEITADSFVYAVILVMVLVPKRKL